MELNRTTYSLQVKNLSVKLAGMSILKDISFCLSPGDCLAIIGPSGSGKTSLLKALAGSFFHAGNKSFNTPQPNISLVSRQNQFTNRAHISDFYYQQRFNAIDAENAETVLESLTTDPGDPALIISILGKVGLGHVKNESLLKLSNGEHKRFQIAKALLQKSDWILFDNPFTGLDTAARTQLNHLLLELRNQGIHMIIATGHGQLPDAITHVAILQHGKLHSFLPRSAYQPADHQTSHSPELNLNHIPKPFDFPAFSLAVNMQNVNIQYGDRLILQNINWKVRNGECWNLRGHNGSGKSTLLSLINGDNPQAFANEIYLFDQRKGSGESIWDIKKKIGFISPELHHYFRTGSPVFDVIASGLFDTIGLFRKLSDQHKKVVDHWINIMQLSELQQRSFSTLSDGEQRRVLLTRTLVKDPPLLILDEPCQGLDDMTKKDFIHLIDTLCRQLKKTMIYVTHLDEEVPPCVSKSLTLQDGLIVNCS